MDINFEYKRKSVRARDIKVASITMVREQATDLWLFDKSKRFVNKNLNEVTEAEEKEQECSNETKCEVMPENFEEKLEEKIYKNQAENDKQLMDDKFVIKIPSNAVKQDLLDLKKFMLTLETGFIKVFIDLKWQEIDTKISLADLDELKNWIENKWK